MNRGMPSLIAGALLVVILGLYMITYQVQFTEVGVIKTFGKATPPQDVIKEPGLYWKWPWPIQSVDVYDARIQVTSSTPEEMPTRDNKPIILTTAIGWRIDDPYVFNRTCGTMSEGEARLKTLIRDIQKTVVSHYGFNNFVSTNPQELQFEKIEKEILANMREGSQKLYGIDVTSVGIKQFTLPQKITETVFEAMRKERQTEVARYTSEGESQAAAIKATAEATAQTILTFADRKAREIISEGLRRANKYNETFREDEELAMFLLKVENLPKLLKEQWTTVVMDETSPLLDVLYEGAGKAPAATQPAASAADDTVALPEMVKTQ